MKCSEGRHRFAGHVEECFGPFLDWLKANPEMEEFLDDKGRGEPPEQYLALVERGLRAFAKFNYIFAMGSGALSSRKAWREVDPWRKRDRDGTLSKKP